MTTKVQLYRAIKIEELQQAINDFTEKFDDDSILNISIHRDGEYYVVIIVYTEEGILSKKQ